MTIERRKSCPALLTKWRGEASVGHESRDTAGTVHRPPEMSPWSGPGPRPWFLQITAFLFFTIHESRNTTVLSWFPAHDFPLFPTISQVPPKKNQVPPRTAAAGSAVSWMHRVAAQAPLACLSRRLARRSTSGSRNTAFPVHCPSDISSGTNQAHAHGFHESRDTKHESRPFYRVLRPSGGEKCRLGYVHA